MYCGNCGNKIENENVSFCKKLILRVLQEKRVLK